MNELKFGAVMESLVISLHVAIPNSEVMPPSRQKGIQKSMKK